MKVFFTGGTGFVGSHLLRQLKNHKDLEIFYLCRSPEKAQRKGIPGTPLKGDLDNIPDLPKDLDMIVHIASVVHSHDEKVFEHVNINGTKNLLDKIKDPVKFVLISSQAAAGPADNISRPVEEDDLPMPVSVYGKSKLAQEKLLKENLSDDCSLVILRPPMVIGPDDDAIGELVQMVKSGVKLIPGRDGENKQYSFISVFDLVNCIEKTILNHIPGTYFVAHHMSLKYGELFREFEHKLHKNTFKIIIPEFLLLIVAYVSYFLWKFLGVNSRLTLDKVEELKIRLWLCSSKKFTETYQYHFQFNLEETVKQTLKISK